MRPYLFFFFACLTQALQAHVTHADTLLRPRYYPISSTAVAPTRYLGNSQPSRPLSVAHSQKAGYTGALGTDTCGSRYEGIRL
ncbi:hypothetical protein L209DRAFT_311064 [Thermothelomyces heterothallicus CBS 203.75]